MEPFLPLLVFLDVGSLVDAGSIADVIVFAGPPDAQVGKVVVADYLVLCKLLVEGETMKERLVTIKLLG